MLVCQGPTRSICHQVGTVLQTSMILYESSKNSVNLRCLGLCTCPSCKPWELCSERRSRKLNKRILSGQMFAVFPAPTWFQEFWFLDHGRQIVVTPWMKRMPPPGQGLTKRSDTVWYMNFKALYIAVGYQKWMEKVLLINRLNRDLLLSLSILAHFCDDSVEGYDG